MADTSPNDYDVATTYDAIGAKYAVAFANVPLQQHSITWILQTLPKGQCKCLDVGSGTGSPVVSTLAAAGHDVLGLDISPEMVRIAKKNVPNARFEIADTKRWTPTADEAGYDAVTVYFSMLASFSQDDIRALIRRLATWLKPGGLFVFATVPMDGNNVPVDWMGHSVVVSSLSPQECVRVIKEAAFEVVEEHTQVFRPKGVEAGLCEREDQIWDEEHLFVYARKI